MVQLYLIVLVILPVQVVDQLGGEALADFRFVGEHFREKFGALRDGIWIWPLWRITGCG